MSLTHMECHEIEFGCLWKNVGGHFPCLLDGLDVKIIEEFLRNTC